MKKISLFVLLSAVLLAGCGSDDLAAKKDKLAELTEQSEELKAQMDELASEIASIEGKEGANTVNAILVNAAPIQPASFVHSIEVRGNVASRTNVFLSAETGGRIEEVRVDEGNVVKKGQVLVVLDNDIIRNNIAEVKTALELATAVFERQSNLWEKKIGTEIQYLEAKNRKESLERQLATLQSQLDKTVIRAPFAGTIDDVAARVGEMAQPGMPLIRVVNPDKMYLEADVSERFIGDFKKGDEVTVSFPIQKKTLKSEIMSVSEVINLENRTFKIEVKMPKVDFVVKPNQVAVLELVDYERENTIVVPTEVILSDGDGKFLYVVSDKDQKTVAEKARIEVGMTQDGVTEVLEGLKTGDQIVLQGYRDLTEGTVIRLTEKSTETAKL